MPTPRSFLHRFHSLLENTAHLLGVHLEVWTDAARPVASHRPTERCLSCSSRDPVLFAACQVERRARARQAMDANEAVEWSCAKGLRLAIQPIASLEPASGALLSVEEGSELVLEPESSEPTLSAHAREGRFSAAPIDEPGTLDGDVYGALDASFLASRQPEPLVRGDELGVAWPEVTTTPASSTVASRRRAFLADLARLLSDQMYVFHEYAQLNGELSSRYEELNMLYSISGRLAHHEDMRIALRQLCAQTRETTSADLVLLSIPGRRVAEILARDGFDLARVGGAREWARILGPLGAAMISDGPREFTGALHELPGLDATAFAPAQVVVTRVVIREVGAGVLAVLRFDRASNFRMSDLKLLRSVAEQVAMAVSNCELYEDLQNFLMATVKSLVNAIEAKDSYTSGHSERVNLISMLIGKAMGLDSSELETLRWASILHDVGKIGMPECILNKPARLSLEEQNIMRQHPDRGYQVLSPIRQLEVFAVSVRGHHERWDGSGYPLGISGREIPQIARIIAVADAFDAITTTRPYRAASSFDFAVRQIVIARGTQLDPEVVDVFLTLIPFLEEHHVMIHAAAESLREEKVA